MEETADVPPPPRDGLQSPHVAAALLALAFLGLYLSTLTADHTYDGVMFAMMVERAVGSGAGFLDLYHPHHVAYGAAAAGFLDLVTRAGVPLGGMALLQVMSALSGALVVLFTWRRVSEWTGSDFLATGVAGVVGAAAGPWFFSTDAECDMPALALTVAAAGPALAFITRGRRADGARAAILLGLAAAFHLTMGLAWIALLVAALLRGRREVGRAVVMLCGAFAILALAYAPRAGILAQQPGPFEPLRLLAFSTEGALSGQVAGEGIQGGYLMSSGFHPRAEAAEALRGFAAGGDGAWGAVALVLRVVPVAAFVLGVVALIRTLVRRRGDPVLVLAATWTLGTWLLFAAWAGRNFEFTPFELVPLALWGAVGAGALLAPAWRDKLGMGLIAVAVALGIANWASYLEPRHDPAKQPLLLQMQVVRERTAPDDRVVVTGVPDKRLKVYAIYYGGRRAIIPEFLFGSRISDEESLRRLDVRLREACASGHALWALPGVVEDVPHDAPFPLERVRERIRAMSPRPDSRMADGFTLYQLSCANER